MKQIMDDAVIKAVSPPLCALLLLHVGAALVADIALRVDDDAFLIIVVCCVAGVSC